MNSDDLNIPKLYTLLQEYFRVCKENQELAYKLQNAEMNHMHAEFALKIQTELLEKLKQIALPTSVQDGGR